MEDSIEILDIFKCSPPRLCFIYDKKSKLYIFSVSEHASYYCNFSYSAIHTNIGCGVTKFFSNELVNVRLLV